MGKRVCVHVMFTHVHVCVEELCDLLADLAAGDCLVLMQCSPYELGPWPYMYMWACPMYLGRDIYSLYVAAPYICPLVHMHVCFCVYMHACAFACMHMCVYHEDTVTIIIIWSTGSPHQFPIVGQYVCRSKFIFREAKINDAILFFDECEAIFETREKGSHNVNLLLTEIERWAY